MARPRKFNRALLGLIAAALAVIGYFVVHHSRATNADINGDGSVNILDLSILAAHYGQTGQTFATGDLNGDGSVNILDLSILASNWGSAGGGSTFMSYPRQTCFTSLSGSNLVLSNKSWQGCSGKAALTISNATNVYIHDLDFDSNSGDIFLTNVSGTIRIENIRARNTGAGTTTIGSGLKNVIQFNNAWQGAPVTDTTAGIRHIKIYGGATEDAVSIFKSGGLDGSHTLVLEDIHVEHPLPPDPLAWTSTTGTCTNLGDAGGHDIILRNSTFLNCGAVGIQMNMPSQTTVTGNILYGALRTNANVGLSQYGTCTCSGDKLTNNRVWWKPSSQYIQHTGYFTDISGNVLNDTTIDPNSLKVVL